MKEGLPVAGYTAQPQSAIDAVNLNKHIEEKILRDMDEMRDATNDAINVDQRWLAIARTKLEEAFMAYNRAIFQPKRVEGELNV